MFKMFHLTDPKFKISQTFYACLYVEKNKKHIIFFLLAYNSGAYNTVLWKKKKIRLTRSA